MFSTSKSLLRGCLMSKWATNHHAICSGIIWSVPNLGCVGTNPLVTFLYMENNNNQQNINFVEYQRLTMRYSNKFNVVDQEKKGFKGEKHDPQNNGDCSEITQIGYFLTRHDGCFCLRFRRCEVWFIFLFDDFTNKNRRCRKWLVAMGQKPARYIYNL